MTATYSRVASQLRHLRVRWRADGGEAGRGKGGGAAQVGVRGNRRDGAQQELRGHAQRRRRALQVRPALTVHCSLAPSVRVARIRERSCVRVLNRFINKLVPGSVKNVQTSTMPFKQMENIGAFQAGAKAYGCSDVEVFQTAVRPLASPILSL